MVSREDVRKAKKAMEERRLQEKLSPLATRSELEQSIRELYQQLQGTQSILEEVVKSIPSVEGYATRQDLSTHAEEIKAIIKASGGKPSKGGGGAGVEAANQVALSLGSSIETLTEVDKRGWVLIQDDTYVNGSGLSLTGSVRTKLDLHTDVVLDDYLPHGTQVSDFWDEDNHKILTPEVGSTYLVRLTMKVNPASSNSSIITQLDIGNGSIPILTDTSRLVRGGGVDTEVSKTNWVYALDTFAQNGCEIYLECTNNAVVSQITLGIERLSLGS